MKPSISSTGLAPGRILERLHRVVVARLAAPADAAGAEVDVLAVVLVIERRREQAHDMHPGQAAIGRHFAEAVVAALVVGDHLAQLGDDVPHPVKLALALDVGCGAARILNVLLAVHDLPHGLRLGAMRVPDVDREDQAIAARIVVEHDLDRRVRKNPAVPIKLAVDADRRESWRKRAGGHDVVERERHVARVEIAHLRGAHARRADGEPGRAMIELIEVDELLERPAQRLDAVIAGGIGAELVVRAEKSHRIGVEEGRYAVASRRACCAPRSPSSSASRRESNGRSERATRTRTASRSARPACCRR